MIWESIETAPKDGTPILGYANGKLAVVIWSEFGKEWELMVSGTYAEDNIWWPVLWSKIHLLNHPVQPAGADSDRKPQ